MDRIVIDKNSASKLTFDRDCYILIEDEVQSKDLELNILGCKVTIIDMSKSKIENINVKDSELTLVNIGNKSDNSEVILNNDNSVVEYNVIDLDDSDKQCQIYGKVLSEGSNTVINIATVCYKNKNKKYVINTSNFKKNTTNEVNCFGIVKDKSVLDYDVTSFIEKGAKQAVVRQNSNILLFDKNSLGKNNPVLLIEENDVKASHGSSIGKIDDDTMFYLCSRGLSKIEATNLICLGKVEYLMNKINDEKIKELVVNNFKERMG